MPILTPSVRAARVLRRLEKTLQNWQDDPDSPRTDVDRMLAIVIDLRQWVQGHVIADLEKAEQILREKKELDRQNNTFSDDS